MKAFRAFLFFFAVLVATLPLVTQASGGELYLSPQNGVYSLGEPFTVAVLANTDGATVNAIEGELTYNPSALAVESVSIDHSILASWSTAPSYDGATGVVRFSGWAGSPYAGHDGLLLTITFRPLKTSSAHVDFTSGAMLANDAVATNIITVLQSGVYTVEPTQVPATLPLSTAMQPTSTQTVSPSALVSFTTVPHTLQEGQIVVVKGVTTPNAEITLWLQRGVEGPQASSLLTAADGTFTYVSDAGVTPGVYHIWAQVRNPDGTMSSNTDPTSFTVESNQVAAAVAAGATYASFFVPLFLVLVLLALGVTYFLHRRATSRERSEI